MADDPSPPTDVRAVMRDGREVPLECSYAGVVDGLHLWGAVWTLTEMPAHVRVAVLPAKSSVVLSVRCGH